MITVWTGKKMTRHPVERLWRECGLPEWFLGNDGSNEKLYALYDAIVAGNEVPSRSSEPVKPDVKGT